MAVAVDLLAHPVTRAEYERLVESGALEGLRAEYIDGWIELVSPHSPRTASVTRRLERQLRRAPGPVSQQLPLDCGGPLPEPDFAVLDSEPPFGQHPTDALLVVEISRASLSDDLGRKARIYWEAGIARYWVVDVEAARVVDHRRDAGAEDWRRVELSGTDALDAGLDGVPALEAQTLFAR